MWKRLGVAGAILAILVAWVIGFRRANELTLSVVRQSDTVWVMVEGGQTWCGIVVVKDDTVRASCDGCKTLRFSITELGSYEVLAIERQDRCWYTDSKLECNYNTLRSVLTTER